MRDVFETRPDPHEPSQQELAWFCLVGLASLSFGVGWFADTLLALF